MRQNFSSGQEIVSDDLNKSQSRVERGILDRIIYEILQRQTDGFFQDSFKASITNPTTILVKKGLGFQSIETESYDPIKKPIVSDVDLNLVLSAADVTNDRIDIICVKADRFNAETENRNYKDETTEDITVESFTIATDWKASTVTVAGTPAGSPTVPSTPVGYIKICEILVVANVGASSITDSRILLPMASTNNLLGNNTYDKDTLMAADKVFFGLSSANIKYNSGTGRLQFTDNGTDYFNMATGGIGEWSAVVSYSINEFVTYNGKQYISLENSNLNNNPVTVIASWKPKDQNILAYVATTNYGLDEAVCYNGLIYTSAVANNINNTPSVSSLFWYEYGAVRAGALMPFAGGVVPSGYLLADGSQISRASYPRLDAAIGTTWGAYTNGSGGAGTTHLVLPNAAKKFLRGTGSGVVIGTAYGALTARPTNAFTDAATSGASANHTHSLPEHGLGTNLGHGSSSRALTNAGGWVNAPVEVTLYATVSGTRSADHTHSVTIDGGGDAETRPENIAVNYIIKY